MSSRYYDHHYGHYRYTKAYYSFGPFRLITILVMPVIALIIIFSFACALSVISEWAEEYPSRARTVLNFFIAVNLIVHSLILSVDHLSWWRSCISIIVNILYIRLMRTFPFISSYNSFLVCTTFAFMLIESAMWYWYMVRVMYYTSSYTIGAFFIFLWIVPIGFIASCIPEEERLPGNVSHTTMTSPNKNIGSKSYITSDHKPKTFLSKVKYFLSDKATEL